MMTDRDCEEEEHQFECWRRDVEQGITGGCLGDDIHGCVRPTDDDEDEEDND